MATINYLDFDLLIERAGDNYTARVLSSPAGQATTSFHLPFSAVELEDFFLKIGKPRKIPRGAGSPQLQAAKTFGGKLFKAVFHDELFGCLRSSLDQVEERRAGLRLRLRLNAPDLIDLPWEYLYLPSLDRFFVLGIETPVVRYLELQQRIPPLKVKPPLKILVMISSPKDLLARFEFAELDGDEEWTKIKKALARLERRKLVIVERLPAADLDALQQHLRRGEYHIFHFIGHGTFDEHKQDGALLLEDATQFGRWVSGKYLGTLLHNHRNLRLAVLNACEGARTSRSDPFAGTAQSLVLQGLSAVIAMQFEITDIAAIAFAQAFYAAIADGYPVDASLVEARTSIFAHGNEVEWGTPVLYMQAHDGRIFDVETVPTSQQEAPKPRQATPPTPRRLLPKFALVSVGVILLVLLVKYLLPLLKADLASLSITTTPPAAAVCLDDSAIGTTPITGYRANTGRVALRIQKPPNYFTLDTTVVLVKGGEAKFAFKLKPVLAAVTIQVSPADAEVILDGESLTPAQLRKRPLSLETHSLNLSRPGYEPLQTQFRVTVRDTTLRYTLAPEGMAFIPGGTFLMGSKEYENERPEHQVYVDAFYMDKYEMTVAQYQRFLKATGRQEPYDWNYSDNWRKQLRYPNQPVVYVNWEDANAYALWLGKRLPTEAEWEYAARGGNTGLDGKPKYQYPWGNEASANRANFDADGNRRSDWERYLQDVGSFSPNGYGLYNMAGNVSEWCADWYGYYDQNSPSRNPKGPSKGPSRVLRGGAWNHKADDLRCANRYFNLPFVEQYNVGFRCARDVR